MLFCGLFSTGGGELSLGVQDLALVSLNLSHPAQSGTHGRGSNCSQLNELHSVQLRLIVSILPARKETQRGTAALQGSHSRKEAELGWGIRTRDSHSKTHNTRPKVRLGHTV